MICRYCKREIGEREPHKRLNDKFGFHFSCPPEAERSEVLQGCPPSATGSADARASDEAGADSSGRSADGSDPVRSETFAACPFCGGQPEMSHPYPPKGFTRIMCHSKNCGVNPDATGYNLKEAREKWNTRAGDRDATAPALALQGQRASQPNAELCNRAVENQKP